MDPLGNRNDYIDTRDGESITYGANNPANEYSTIHGVAVTYDAAGNLTMDEEGFAYTYDFENRLIGATTPTGAVTFDYDALGRRIRKTDSSGSTLFYYDAQNVIAEYNGTGALGRYFINGSQYIDERILMGAGGVDRYYLSGNLCSVTGMTDARGDILESYSYDAYGKPSVFGAGGTPIPTSAFANPYAFTGRRIDWLPAGAGEHKPIYHYRARWYDPEHGRFGQRDPLGMRDITMWSEGAFHGSFGIVAHESLTVVYPQGMQLYDYTLSSPVNYADSTGESPVVPGTDPEFRSNLGYRDYQISTNGHVKSDKPSRKTPPNPKQCCGSCIELNARVTCQTKNLKQDGFSCRFLSWDKVREIIRKECESYKCDLAPKKCSKGCQCRELVYGEELPIKFSWGTFSQTQKGCTISGDIQITIRLKMGLGKCKR